MMTPATPRTGANAAAIKIGCAALYPITRYGFPYSFDDYMKALDEMKAAGFSDVELEINVDLDLDEYLARVAEVQQRLRGLELTLSAVILVVQQAFSTDATAADETLRRFDLATQFNAAVGCETACVCAYMPKEIEMVAGTEVYAGSPATQVRVPPDFDWHAFWDNAVARFRQMARLAAARGQRLIIENRVGDFVNTSDGALKLVEDAGEPNGGLLLDVAHMHATKEFFQLVVPKMGRRLMYVHLADNDGSFSHHLPAGQGNVDFLALLRTLKASGYSGYANVDFGGVPPDKIWAEAKRGREYFEGLLAQL
ncbi:MAG TPA: sugar phosphate isomerase/epimerase [Anaerolineae bacterium]|nr:sugar phosphate isomerase/epimerase [Anaerolineae bacterium]